MSTSLNRHIYKILDSHKTNGYLNTQQHLSNGTDSTNSSSTGCCKHFVSIATALAVSTAQCVVVVG